MKRDSLLFAAFLGVCCSVSFIGGYGFHSAYLPERAAVAAAITELEVGRSVLNTYMEVIKDELHYQEIHSINTLEDLAVLKAKAKDRTIARIEELEELAKAEKVSFRKERNSPFVVESQKIKARLTATP